jgi:aryl-alcohol dehydrogenase-like predicted oxidoreductase
MEYRELGRTGVKVSALCLGTMTWGEQNTEQEGHAQMDYALDHGINFFDTSEMYAVPPKPQTQGATERIIGTWFKARGNRSKVVLATKVAGRSPMNWLRADGSPSEQTPAQIAEAVDASLKRLNTDYIDLYQLHWPDRPVAMFGATGLAYRHLDGKSVPIEDILGALDAQVKAGKIRMQSIQNAYSLINRVFELGQAEIAHREQVGLLAYSPLGQGYLTGKYQKGAQPEGSRKKLFNRLQRYERPQTETAIDRYLEIARKHGLDPAQLALQFVTTRPFVTSNIIGATTMDQLKTNIGSINVKWTDELEKAVDDAHHLQPNPAP